MPSWTSGKVATMAAKKILMLVGDFVEDYEVMVPFQALLMVGHTVTPSVRTRKPATRSAPRSTTSKATRPTAKSPATTSRSTPRSARWSRNTTTPSFNPRRPSAGVPAPEREGAADRPALRRGEQAHRGHLPRRPAPGGGRRAGGPRLLRLPRLPPTCSGAAAGSIDVQVDQAHADGNLVTAPPGPPTRMAGALPRSARHQNQPLSEW